MELKLDLEDEENITDIPKQVPRVIKPGTIKIMKDEN
jgi:hypothetical protein